MTEKALMELIHQLGQLHIEGNVVPPSWYQHLKYPGGKPYHIAITLLSEIVYWFRPRMVRDEATGDFVGWAKKFKGDGIQRSYAAWGAPFGFTKRESADAIKFLVAEGLITTEIRDVILPDGTLRPNVVVVTSVDPAKLRAITYTRRGGHTPGSTTQTPPERYDAETEEVVPQNVIPLSGYNGGTDDLLPQAAASSSEPAAEGATAGRNNLETKHEIILETNLENSYQPGGESVTEAIATPEAQKILEKTTGVTTPPAAMAVAAPVAATPAEAGKSNIPAVLIKAKSRRAVLELGQRPGREDYAFPNVAAACAWAGKAWQLPLVLESAEDAALLEALSALESTLATIRERALREKQLTFTQVLEDYLAQDSTLRAQVGQSLSSLSRLQLFLAAVRDIDAQWDDAPSTDDLAALRSLLSEEDNAA